MMQARRDGTLKETVDRLFASEGAPLRSWIVQTWESMSVGVIDEFDPDWMRFAPQVTCPVTIIHGDTALGGGGPGPGKYFDANQTGLELVRIEGAGHYLHATHARIVAEQVVQAAKRSLALQ
jgi:pimeloyl-ACP methyl ester carboxylesterase